MKLISRREITAQVAILLNPHGSDETHFKLVNACEFVSFLTHTVQMKHFSIMKIIQRFYYFLTHTVQMKLNIVLNKSDTIKTLLNPHGSDETSYVPDDYSVRQVLLNPHGSDETQCIKK